MNHRMVQAWAARTVIVLALIGIPALLVAVAGNPLPSTAQLAATLRLEPDWGNTVLLTSLLPCAAWIAWAIFAYPLLGALVELRLGRRLLPAIGVLRLQQHVAATLVAAALLGGSTTGAATGTAERPSAMVTEPAGLQPGLDSDAPVVLTSVDRVRATAAVGGQQPEGLYRVREGDTLWDIADHRLGAGSDYPEIVKASTGIEQSGGRHLTDPDLILPGWQLDIPTGPQTTAPHPPTSQTQTTRPRPTPTDSSRASEPAATQSPTPTVAPEPSRSAPHQEAGRSAPVHDDAAELAPVVGGAGAAGLLPAGILAVLTRRRRRQRAARQLGERLPVPDEGAVADLELQFRAVADPAALQDVHRAMMLIGDFAQQAGESLPELFAVRVDDAEIALYLRRPTVLPLPYVSVFDDNTVWALPREALTGQITTAAVSPYPALVTVGTDLDGGILLLDLEQQTALDITTAQGPRAVAGMLNAIAAELATVPWGEDIHLSLVNVPEHLALQLDPYRIHRVTDTRTLCRELRTHLADRRATLDAHGVPDVRAARLRQDELEAWAPFVALIGGTLTAAEQTELDALLHEYASTGLVIVQQRESPHRAASIDLEPEGATYRSAGSDVAALPFIPQRVSDDVLADALRLFELAEVPPTSTPAAGVPNHRADLAEPLAPSAEQGRDVRGLDRVDTLHMPHRAQVAAANRGSGSVRVRGSAPYVRILGQIDVEHLERPELMPGRGIEFLTYLLHHRQPIPGAQIQKALWPNTYDPTNNNARTLAKQVRAALGHDPDGHLWLPEGKGPTGFTLHPAIRSDWHDFTNLISGPTTAEVEDLARALRIVRGQPFLGGGQRGRWAWRSPLEESVIAGVLDAAENLGARALDIRNAALTRLAANAARLIDPLSEVGWRIELRAARERGNAAEVERIVRDLLATVGFGEPDYQPDPETSALIDATRAHLLVRGQDHDSD